MTTHAPETGHGETGDKLAEQRGVDLAPGGDDETVDYSKYSILIVDDNAQNVELLQAYLEVLPCQTHTVSDGIEAMSFIEDPEQPTPDLVLLDVMMPRMSGFEVCRRLKEDRATQTIPVMMITALNELGDIERGVESGTDDFLTKPVNKLELITRVKSLLRVRHLKRELDRTMAYIETIEGRPKHPRRSETTDPSRGHDREDTPPRHPRVKTKATGTNRNLTWPAYPPTSRRAATLLYIDRSPPDM